MLKDLRQGAEIRRRLLVDGVSKRQLLRATGRPWRTREKILRHSPPPGFPTQDPWPQPKLGPFRDRIPLILAEDKHAPRKQRHTAQRSVERLGEAGDAGGSSVVRAAVRQARRRGREVFVPLAHPPGEA